MNMAECVQIFMPQFKRCSKCGQVKALSDFTKDKKSKYGRFSQCKVCKYAGDLLRRRKRGIQPVIHLMVNGKKRCTKCNIWKSLDCFGKDKHGYNGYAAICKPCRVKHQREYSNSEDGKRKMLEWLESGGREKRKAYCRDKYIENSNDINWVLAHRKRVSDYYKTEAGKQSRQRDAHSETRKIWASTYYPIYYQRPQTVMNRYKRSRTEKRRNWQRQYEIKRRESKRVYTMQRYYYLQDKYGNHGTVADWYSSYKLIWALETAPIVEVKV